MTGPRRPVRSRLIFMLISFLCLVPFATGALSGSGDKEEDSLFKQLSVLSEVLTLIQRVYVDETSIDGLLSGALEGATDALDPLSSFVPPEAVESYESVRAVGDSHSGLRLAKDRGIAYAVTVADNSPGEKAGVENGDVIASIDGESTRSMPLWVVESRFAGELGRVLKLEILRAGQSHEMSLELGTYSLATSTIEREGSVPVLRVANLEAGAAGEIRDALTGLATSKPIVVDLRGLSGGDAETAYEVGAFFASGYLGQLLKRGDQLRAFSSDLPAFWSGDVAVLVDGSSQGAAEILATVLHQSAGATLVGEPTFGLAGRRGIVELTNGGQLILTDAYYCGPDDEPLNQRIRPDEFARAAFGETEGDSDVALERALEVLADRLRDAA